LACIILTRKREGEIFERERLEREV
jgi:hypothetical protein